MADSCRMWHVCTYGTRRLGVWHGVGVGVKRHQGGQESSSIFNRDLYIWEFKGGVRLGITNECKFYYTILASEKKTRGMTSICRSSHAILPK